jgi:hypothetical protein
MSIQATPPFWFLQRQGKVEPAGPDAYRLTAPNLREAFIIIRPADAGRWQPALRLTSDGPDVATGPAELTTPREAWEAAFELYRVHLVV